MIALDSVGKAFRNRKGAINWVLRDLTAVFKQGENVGILGGAGSGKTTLVGLISGVDLPSEGTIRRQGILSWPYASRSHVNNRLSGKQNLRFLSDIYGRNFEDAIEFVKGFSDIGKNIDLPMRQYTNEMRGRFLVSALLAMNFDCLLIDGDLQFGDALFRRRTMQYIDDNLDKMSLVIASSNVNLVSKYCQTSYVLDSGRLHPFASTQDAISAFTAKSGAFA